MGSQWLAEGETKNDGEEDEDEAKGDGQRQVEEKLLLVF